MNGTVNRCAANITGEETRCTGLARSPSQFCKAHKRECDSSVRIYKAAAERAEELRPRAVISRRQIQSLHSLAAVSEAVKATEGYLEAIKEEARGRVAHTEQFYANESKLTDEPNGHQIRVDKLLDKIDTCTSFLEQLRRLERGLEEDERKRKVLAVTYQRNEARLAQIRAIEQEHLNCLAEQEEQRREETSRREREWQQELERRKGEDARRRAGDYRASTPVHYDPSEGGSVGSSIGTILVAAAVGYGAYTLLRALYVGSIARDAQPFLPRNDGRGLKAWAQRQLATTHDKLGQIMQNALAVLEEAAIAGAGDWIRSSLRSVGDSLSQLVPAPAESEGMAQPAIDAARRVAEEAIGNAQRLSESALSQAHKLAGNVAGEAQKVAEDAAKDARKWVQEGLNNDQVKELMGAVGIRW